jgi:hypothetical protein
LRKEVLNQEFQRLQDKLLRGERLNESESARYRKLPAEMK